MLNVLSPEEVLALIEKEFQPPCSHTERLPLRSAFGRVLAENIDAEEFVPGFNRSTVDGYALRAADTFGCSEAVPAILPVTAEIRMGESAGFALEAGNCCYVPTGGEIPEGADCAVMLEYAENYGDGTVGILKPGAPGLNMIRKGDDVYPGKRILSAGHALSSADIGALSAIGKTSVEVMRTIRVGIISTGDELVPPDSVPGPGQIRDVNSPMLEALFCSNGFECTNYGIVPDDKEKLQAAVKQALDECDAVVLSGGSSVGIKDAACEIIERFGRILFHGIAIKPGKPTILGVCGGKPVAGLPGHPVAAFFVSRLFILPLLYRISGRSMQKRSIKAVLSESLGANHGRAQVNAVTLSEGTAYPIRTLSGLITQLAGADGFIYIGRDCEGLEKGAEVEVFL